MKRAPDWPKIRQRPDGYWVVDCGVAAGGGPRIQYVRKTQKLAEGKGAELRAERDRVGASAFNLTARQRMDAAEAYLKLAEKGHSSLTDAVEFFLSHKGDTSRRMTVRQVYDSLMARQESQHLSVRSKQTTRCKLTPFVASLGSMDVADLTFRDVRTWIDGSGIKSPVTMRTTILYLNLLFQHAKAEECIQVNPIEKIPRPKVEYSMPTFMEPETVAKIMAAAEAHHPEVVARLAVGFFAGLRSCELDKLMWTSINFEEGIISVFSTKTSSGQLQSIPRHVTMQANLRRWLTAYPGQGSIGPRGKKLTEIRKKLREELELDEIPENTFRHSFASYHMAKFRNADGLAAELGHLQGVRVLYRHYRGMATASQAETYWGILPKKEAEHFGIADGDRGLHLRTA